jgi:copper chaperone NosL
VKIGAVLLIAVWAGACAARAAGPPVIVIDRSACSRCGMLISEHVHAAAIRMPDGSDRLFDDIGCLVSAARDLPSNGIRFWFHDATDGSWIEGVSPAFVVSDSLRTPMGGGILAYRTREAAEQSGRRHPGRVLTDVAALLAEHGSLK